MRYDAQRALAGLRAVPATPSPRAGPPRPGAPSGSGSATRRPLTIGQLGQSLDGRIATPTGKSKYISGTAALAHLHRLRAAVDAVVVGVGTVIADDPQLTVREVPGRSPLRVIIDPNGRLPADARCLAPGMPGRTLVIRAEGAADAPAGAETLRLTCDGDAGVSPGAILDALGRRGAARVLIEGGADTLSRAIAAGVVDLLHVTVSPIILGSGTPGLALPPIDELAEGLHPVADVFSFEDGDTLFCCDLRRRRASAPVDIRATAAE